MAASGAQRGVELAYAEKTTNVTGISSAADVTGLTISFTVGTRPVMVEAVLPLVGQVTSTGQPTVFITASDNSAYSSAQPPSIAATGLYGGFVIKKRFAAGAGAVTTKVRAQTTAGTVSIFSDVTRPSYIQATEV